MAIQIATFGPKVGTCNICGEHGPLTEDHVPPKGCVRISQVEMKHITHKLSVDTKPARGRLSQNGVKYRTLCPRCNNSLLGARYDPGLRDFVNQVANCLRSPLHLPESTTLAGEPQKIMRAVLGHLSAQGVDRYLKGPNTEAFRDYFLDETLPFPDGLRIYYWVYPFQPQVLVRDCAYLDTANGQPVALWLMKFFPLAFLVTWQDQLPNRFDLCNFDPWRHSGIDDRADLPIRLRPIVHPNWPEAPTDNAVLLYGQEAMVASPRSKANALIL